MKSIVMIGIVITGIVSSVVIFAFIPSDTWQDKRTGFTGLPLPDENKEKIDCLSKRGLRLLVKNNRVIYCLNEIRVNEFID